MRGDGRAALKGHLTRFTMDKITGIQKYKMSLNKVSSLRF